MYKVMIVDDEVWVAENIKSSVDWNSLGFEVVGQAYNGLHAYELINKLKPDVVFTDIRMPGMDGLELIRKTAEAGLHSIFIVISGYAEFEYAKKAIEYGAIGYCLKPLQDIEIQSNLKRALVILNSKVSFDAIFYDLFDNNSENQQKKIVDVFRKYEIKWDELDEVMIAVSVGTGELKLPDKLNMYTIKMGINKKLHIVGSRNFAYISKHFEHCLSNDINGIGLSRVISKIGEIADSYDEASMAAYHFFVTGAKGIYLSTSIRQNGISPNLFDFETSIKNKDVRNLEKAFNIIEAHIQNGLLNIMQSFLLYNTIMYFLHEFANEQREDYIYNYEQLPNYFSNINSMIKYLKEFSAKQLLGETASLCEEIKNETLKTILQYVNQNFWKDISIQSISKEFYINLSYTCQLFKRETGKTFTEYVSDLRINYACKLLKKSDLPVNEIAEKTGYNDYFYFNKIFKKVTGKTPIQYRNT